MISIVTELEREQETSGERVGPSENLIVPVHSLNLCPDVFRQRSLLLDCKIVSRP
jgi:hypothetical protein